MNNFYMFGQFSGPVTGERSSNEYVESLLRNHACVTTVDTTIITDASEVGFFSFRKLFRSAVPIFKSIGLLFKKVDCVYVTPGQTSLGVLRFWPLFIVIYIRRIPAILHWHGYGVVRNSSALTFAKPFFRCKFIANVFLTKDLVSKLNLEEVVVHNPVVLPNPFPVLDEVFLDKLKCEKLNFSGLNSTKPVVLYMGSLVKEKGIIEFLEVAKKLNSKANFVVCGHGSSKIITDVEGYARCGFVEYLGLVSGDEKIRVLSQARFFVLLSDYETEGVPISMLEAMAFGAIPIVLRHNGLPEALAGSGIILEKKSSSVLFDSLNQCLVDLANEISLRDRVFTRSLEYTQREFECEIIRLFERVSR